VNSLHAALYYSINSPINALPQSKRAWFVGCILKREVRSNYPAYLPQGLGQDRGTFRRKGDAGKWQQFLHQSDDAMLPKFPWPHCPVQSQSTLREHKSQIPQQNGLMTVRYFAPSRYIFGHVCLTTGFSVSFCSLLLNLPLYNCYNFQSV
jgi:hypothetical protein